MPFVVVHGDGFLHDNAEPGKGWVRLPDSVLYLPVGAQFVTGEGWHSPADDTPPVSVALPLHVIGSRGMA